jgi:hypothetical protein
MNIMTLEFRYNLMLKYFTEFYRVLADDFLNSQQYRFRVIVQFLHGLFTDLEKVAVIGYPDPEEFIEVATVDSQEFNPFQEGDIGVLGFLENPVIER